MCLLQITFVAQYHTAQALIYHTKLMKEKETSVLFAVF